MKISWIMFVICCATDVMGAVATSCRPDEQRETGKLSPLWGDWTFDAKAANPRCALSEEMRLCYLHFKDNHPDFRQLLAEGNRAALIEYMFELNNICHTPCIAHFKRSSRSNFERIADCCSRQLQTLIQQDLINLQEPTE